MSRRRRQSILEVNTGFLSAQMSDGLIKRKTQPLTGRLLETTRMRMKMTGMTTKATRKKAKTLVWTDYAFAGQNGHMLGVYCCIGVVCQTFTAPSRTGSSSVIFFLLCPLSSI